VDLQAPAAALIASTLQTAAEQPATLGLVHCVPGTDAFPDRYFDAEFETLPDSRRPRKNRAYPN
jgi:hypothetical protein